MCDIELTHMDIGRLFGLAKIHEHWLNYSRMLFLYLAEDTIRRTF